jgi:hypothetical protein
MSQKQACKDSIIPKVPYGVGKGLCYNVASERRKQCRRVQDYQKRSIMLVIRSRQENFFRQIDARLNLEQRTRVVPRGLTKRVSVAHAKAFYFVYS